MLGAWAGSCLEVPHAWSKLMVNARAVDLQAARAPEPWQRPGSLESGPIARVVRDIQSACADENDPSISTAWQAFAIASATKLRAVVLPSSGPSAATLAEVGVVDPWLAARVPAGLFPPSRCFPDVSSPSSPRADAPAAPFAAETRGWETDFAARVAMHSANIHEVFELARRAARWTNVEEARSAVAIQVRFFCRSPARGNASVLPTPGHALCFMHRIRIKFSSHICRQLMLRSPSICRGHGFLA